jgi:acetyl-CoA synthetase
MKIKKKRNLFFPTEKIKQRAWLKDKKIYRKASKDPVKFWDDLAKELIWSKKWKKTFSHNPPFFSWFEGGKINITYNVLDKNLEKRKDKIALIWEPESIKEKPKILTYYDLYREVNRVSNALKGLGVKKDDIVGIYLPMIPEVIISMLACARIGAVHTVVFSAFSPEALKIRLRETEAKILITADGYFRRGKLINLKENADSGIKGTKVKKVIVVKRAKNKINFLKGRDYFWDNVTKGKSDYCKPVNVDSEDPLFILFTSGSTGMPKGCLHTSGGYAVQAYWTGKWIFDLHEDDVFWSTADVGWITGHTYSCYSPLLNGATFVIYEGSTDYPNPDRWCKIIEKYGVTVFYTSPTAIRMFKKYGVEKIKDYKLDTLKLLGSVGEPIDESTWEWFFEEVGKKKCPIVDTWWQTETGGILITSLPGIGPFKPAFTGLPFPGINFNILDEKGKSQPNTKQGNLVILPPFAPGLLRKVYKNPEKYKEEYFSKYGNKIYFTSDLAYRDKNGLIRIVGRADDVVKVAGHRLTTGELENLIELNKRVAESAVIGVPHEIKGEVPVAFIVLKSGKPSEKIKKELAENIEKKLGKIARLANIYFVDTLPKTRSGKIMRRVLRRILMDEKLGDLSTLANPESVKKIRKSVK